jgi:iron uptake system component EfeO
MLLDHRRVGLVAAAAAGAALGCAGCSQSPPSAPGPPAVSVKTSDTACEVATTTFTSGTRSFAVANAGSQKARVSILAAGDRVVGDVENIEPSTSKRLTVSLKPGVYQLACLPKASGPEIRTPITVKAPSGGSPTTSPQLDAAVASYRHYVIDQAALLIRETKPFTDAVRAGDLLQARGLYAAARAPYERIRPIVAAMGDLDARINARLDEVQVSVWTGFHRLEYELFETEQLTDEPGIANQLDADVAKIAEQVPGSDISADQIAAGAKGMMQDVKDNQITGHEERYSGLDLVDVAASTDGAMKAYDVLKPIVRATDPDLVAKLDQRFAQLRENLAQYGSGTAFAQYDALTSAQWGSIGSDVDALIGPLSELASEIAKS